ncbi:helix-turn-helix transcriptional regulator [Streptomyces spinosisporus]|uniref:Helix-turn-helix domain-containing protein n=1 Tax=Streptomyces spinosisporus TaxID=2927582 RepID=A0ABS9XW16_9ACTN|nr:helix-turn-helix transcriptional regulator [Streptomyces spinosisporus]MCI3246275.1 helix-turn-helix domain-containing protein [Streptomyces spinosisporus]
MSSRGLWADVALRAAWARADWAAVLYEYRRVAGLTQRQLESLVGLPQPHISAIESRRRTVKTEEVKTRITEGLHVPPELKAAGQSSRYADWDPSGELRDRIAHGHANGRTDLRTADWIGRVLAEHRRAEDEQAGPDLWPVVRAQLDAVTQLIPGTTGAAADRLMLLAAEHAHWLSWVAWQEQRRGAALAWIDLAHGWAVDGGHTDMQSWAQRVRAYYSLNHGDPVRALRTAEAARFAGPRPLSPAAESVAVHQAAMAAAACAERDRARRLADEAHELALRAGDERDRPGWLYWLDQSRARLQLADAAYACRAWADAAAGFREALPALAGFPRDQAYYRARLEDAERRA